jgi:hypothetical protein
MDAWIFLGLLVLAWLISPIILVIALIVARRQLHGLRQRPSGPHGAELPTRTHPPPSPSVTLGGARRLVLADLENLALLRLELQRHRDSGDLAEDQCHRWVDDLDRLWAQHLRETGAVPESEVWRRRRALAWNLLARGSDAPLGAPPWQSVAAEPLSTSPAQASPPVPESPSVPASPFALPPVPKPVPLPPPGPPTLSKTPSPLVGEGWGGGDQRSPSTIPSPLAREDRGGEGKRPTTVDADWRPAAPTPLERALHALSGWPRLIAPFLAQNIGWFVGGFCFVAGALFLIANTEGFINALVVFASLFGASAFLLWAGYQFRQRRPELAVASGVLLSLGMLLAPLVLAVAVRLASASGGDTGLLILGLLLAIGTLAAFAWAAALASGVMDRALLGRYPRLLTALAAVQLAAPLAAVAPDWRVLAGWHVLLLGLLGYGLRAFSREWLQRLFVDRRLTSAYAAGLLVYTATVSFAHLTWIWPGSLPPGYAGPFLMALCGLLFLVDAAFKDWVHKYAFLSRFSFALYGGSVAAAAVAAQARPTLLLTLAMGALLYGWVTWRYRTWPPLYLLFGCVVGLYGYGILQLLPPAWHGLAGLPGLVALLALARWAGSRSRTIAVQCLLLFGVLLLGLTVWSLIWNAPGWLGFATVALAAVLTYQATRLALALPDADPRWAWADGVVVALATVAVAYAPAWAPIGWEWRTAFGWLALAGLWSGWVQLRPALRQARALTSDEEGALPEQRLAALGRALWVTGALLNIALAVALGGWTLWPEVLGRWEPILLLALAGLLLLWLSLGLRQQALFYGVLACAAAVGILIKRGYFPGPSTGLVEFALVLALWAFLWQLGWRFPLDRLRVEKGSEDRTPPSGVALVRAPLEQAMALLWLVGLVHLGQRWMTGESAWFWPGTALLAMATGLALVGHFQQFHWVALPMGLGLAGLLVGLERLGAALPWLGAAAVLYALLVWRLGIAVLAQPLTWRVVKLLSFAASAGGSGRRQAEDSLHGGAVLVAAVVVAASPALALMGWAAPVLWPGLALGLLLFGLAGARYRSELHAYAALLTLTVGVWLTDAWWAAPDWWVVGQPLSNGLLGLLVALAALGLTADRAASLAYWRAPLAVTSSVLYGLALAGAVLGFLAADPRLPVVLILLCVALFPVARPWPNAADWRGLGLAVLSSALVAHLAEQAGFNAGERAGLALGWGYALWLGGNLLLPRWNARWPDWAVAPMVWPLLGLGSAAFGIWLGWVTGAWPPAAALGGLALYLFLLLRNTAWPGLAWLAVATLAASGLLAAGVPAWGLWDSGLGGIVTLIWLNGLLLLIPWWRSRGRTVAAWLIWRQADLVPPLFWLPFAVLVLLLGQLVLLEFNLLWGWTPPLESGFWPLTGSAALLAATAGHAVVRRSDALTAQVLVTALGAVLGAILLDLRAPLAVLPLVAAGWAGALLLVWRYGPQWLESFRPALEPWLIGLPVLSLGLLFVVPEFSGWVWAATLFVLAAAALAWGGWRDEDFSTRAGLLLALAGGYALWWVNAAAFAWTTLVGLAPWYALQTGLLWLAVLAIQRPYPLTPALSPMNGGEGAERSRRGTVVAAEEEISPRGWRDDLARAAGGLIPGLPVLSGLWLVLHGYVVVGSLAGAGLSPWYFGVPADPLAAGAALALLTGLAAARAWRRSDAPIWVYVTVLLLGAFAGYGRLLVLGLAPATVGDTAALMAAGYAAFLLHQWTGSPPLYRLALLLPLLALATAPWQLASPWTGGTLLAAAVLYLSLAGTLRNPLPLYLGVLALNGTVYLWAPLWAERYGLWQFYLIPAAVSVLALLHLHRRELRPSVLNGARLAALSVLYAGAALDVFLRPELGVFALALALALLGIAVGVALRVRAFLYAGVAFLVLNVVGQLLRFYPEQGLGRALILLGLGAVITLGMVVFSLQREAILQRIRIARADLAAWE